MHEDYMDLEYEEWDGVTPLVLHDGDEYFFSDDDIESYVDLDDERKFEDLDLVICEPVFARLLDEELWWSDDLPDDTTMEDVFGADFTHLMDAMNEILRSKPSCWRQGTKRTSYSPEWRAKNEDD
ncbi:MAG: hypothetical protein Q8O94_02900 [bacterium]|nr:hypothetical protein [bacterium]